jgi:HlyD family secretion protein
MKIKNMLKNYTKFIIPIIIIVILFFCIKGFFFKETKEQMFIRVKQPLVENIISTVNAKGIVKPDKENIMLGYQPVRIEKIVVEKGDVVKKGDLLLVGSSTDSSSNQPTNFVAPCNGVISEIAQIGQCFDKTSEGALVKIINLDDMLVESMVSEQDISKVKVGQDVQITADTVKGTLQGKVIKISSVAENSQSGSRNQIAYIDVKIEFENKNHVLKPDYNVNVSITTDSARDALTLPKTAFLSENGKRYVYLLDKNNIVHKQTLTTGLSSTYAFQVSGLKKTDRIITTPSDDIRSGMKINQDDIVK